MMQDILIGSAYTLNGESVIDSGQAVEELLAVYNDL